MSVLVLGGSGMLGHKVWQALRTRTETFVTLRRPLAAYAARELFDANCAIDDSDLTAHGVLERALDRSAATVVINASGLVKQRPDASSSVASIELNSLLPHRIAQACQQRGARLIHISTDCVYSGTRGAYQESDTPDPTDLYGRSKWLGEPSAPGCLTLRTSMIGRELESRVGLLEWMLAHRGGSVHGYARAILSGLTTRVLAGVIAGLVDRGAPSEGLWHVSAAAINKYDLLQLVNTEFGLGVRIERDEELVCDRSLDSSRFRHVTGFQPPSWPEMLHDTRTDPTPYGSWRL